MTEIIILVRMVIFTFILLVGFDVMDNMDEKELFDDDFKNWRPAYEKHRCEIEADEEGIEMRVHHSFDFGGYTPEDVFGCYLRFSAFAEEWFRDCLSFDDVCHIYVWYLKQELSDMIDSVANCMPDVWIDYQKNDSYNECIGKVVGICQSSSRLKELWDAYMSGPDYGKKRHSFGSSFSVFGKNIMWFVWMTEMQ